ncbi:flagellar biosynthesis protein FlgJ [Erythrobacter sp. 3-20A1M]|uniref:rod-binding protein n=1 Tax=Erythrobacter sp. 3-20A1M TaxID=2653850 RepID=UPI001BFBFE48|nr:rod-binding protein [Erythrobacter sp. 3-20A1M]QWC57422.1 flagellar biosynthesis protein FlgJ [Erythrobacter sp. 3-20A1M]
MSPLSAIGPASGPATPELSPERAELRKAARGFEAIFVRRMLEAARAADFGGDDVMGAGGMEQFSAMRDEHLADIAAERSSFGIADAIEAQLSARLDHREG